MQKKLICDIVSKETNLKGCVDIMTIGQCNAAIYRTLQMMLSDKLKKLEIKNGQYDFFYVISCREGITQKQLSEHLYISKSTTAKAVKSLVNSGYIKKEKNQSDNRVEHLYLTELGHLVSSDVKKIFKENLKIAEKGLSTSELEQISALQEKILNNLLAENENHKGESIK